MFKKFDQLHSTPESAVFQSMSILLFIFIFVFNISVYGEQQFTFLSEAFLQGKLYFLEQPLTWADTTFYQNHYYWPLGPFPAVLLMPFSAVLNFIGIRFYQGYLSFILSLIIFGLVFKIARFYKYTKSDSIIWAYAFCFSTVFIGVSLIPFSWWYAQVVAVFLLLLSFWVFIRSRNYLLIGLICACLVGTRIPATLVWIFYLYIAVKESTSIRLKLVRIMQLFTPVLIAIGILAIYNYLRFGNILEQGYSTQLLIEPLTKAREYGLFSIIHIPGNLYYSLLSLPEPVFKDGVSHVLTFPFLKANPWGMSIFVTSPLFVYLFKLRKRAKYFVGMITTILLISAMVFSYYGIGFRQYGYRYSLDFLPLLFILLMASYNRNFPQLTRNFKLIVLGSSLVNLYLLLGFIW